MFRVKHIVIHTFPFWFQTMWVKQRITLTVTLVDHFHWFNFHYLFTCTLYIYMLSNVNTTDVCNLRQNPRQNPVRDKIQSETKSSLRQFFLLGKILSQMLSRISSVLFFQTNHCLSSRSGICIPQ